jgi:hypothetical protein
MCTAAGHAFSQQLFIGQLDTLSQEEISVKQEKFLQNSWSLCLLVPLVSAASLQNFFLIYQALKDAFAPCSIGCIRGVVLDGPKRSLYSGHYCSKSVS